MQRNTLSKALRQGQLRSYASNAPRASRVLPSLSPRSAYINRTPLAKNTQRKTQSFSTSYICAKGLSPESEDPQPTEREYVNDAAVPAELSAEEFTELSDLYMDAIVEKMDQLQEEREAIDFEYSAGVMTLTFPPHGTYVINKQPPNKQIWLSSPISGPKRYDWVVVNEGQNAKEGTGGGDWVYLRDMSTLRDLLLTEVSVDLSDILDPVVAGADE